jgi:Fanconi-associated nuclease 1
MDLPEFYESRKHIIKIKLEKLKAMHPLELRRYFEDEYEKHKHKHNPLVNWDNPKLTKTRMGTILSCMGSKVLCMFLGRLAINFKEWSFGMPDLILWKFKRKEQLTNNGIVGYIKFAKVISD